MNARSKKRLEWLEKGIPVRKTNILQDVKAQALATLRAQDLKLPHATALTETVGEPVESTSEPEDTCGRLSAAVEQAAIRLAGRSLAYPQRDRRWKAGK